MNKKFFHLFFVFIIFATIVGCEPKISPIQITSTQTLVDALPSYSDTPSPATPTITAVPKGDTILVTSVNDHGPGTLRQILLDAKPGDVIHFSSTEFSPQNPATIFVESALPLLNKGFQTIDASDSGVILDGSNINGEWTPGLEISSKNNLIKGLQIINFSGPGILLNKSARFNLIGGDRTKGIGPLGEGNLIGGNSDGIAIMGSGNVITGNLIGTGITSNENFGNYAPGVFFEEYASQNIIGPDNVIAYNLDSAIEFRNENSKDNIITANFIYDNLVDKPAISYNFKGCFPNSCSNPPLILDYDLSSGTVSGLTCANCYVEIFSTHYTDGEFFEGSVTADSKGAYNFSTSVPFSGPLLVATTKSPGENTSEFSIATTGAKRTMIIQMNNDSQKSLFFPKPSIKLDFNWVGDTFTGYSPPDDPELVDLLDEMIFMGHKWIRLSFTHGDWPIVESTGEFSPLIFDSKHDQFISNLYENNFPIMYNLVYFPETLKDSLKYNRLGTESDIEEFLEYAKMIATRYKGKIQYYEVWNEPNVNAWQQNVSTNNYIKITHKLIPIIREADPQAKIVIGATANLQGEKDYFFNLIQSDIIPLVDGISIHPMYGVSPEHRSSYYYGYPNLIRQIREIAFRYGFDGIFFSEEMAWETIDNVNGWMPFKYSETVAAKYYSRAILFNRGLNLWAGVGVDGIYPRIVQAVRNLNTILSGAEPTENIVVEIESEAQLYQKFVFSIPNGDYLVFLWTDGVANDDDPGVSSTVIIPGFGGWDAIGVDPFYGYEQKLISENNSDNLIINNFLIKDYPMVIHLKKFM
jgi:hypothetical protein